MDWNDVFKILIQLPIVAVFIWGFFKLLDRFDKKEKENQLVWVEAITRLQLEFTNFIRDRDLKMEERHRVTSEIQSEMVKQLKNNTRVLAFHDITAKGGKVSADESKRVIDILDDGK